MMLPMPKVDFRRMPVTLILTAVAVALEIVCSIDPDRRHAYYNAMQLGILSPIWSGQWWRPFTTTVLHGNLMHVGFNAYWMILFGRLLEPRYGSFRYLGLLVLLGYTSTMLPFLVNNLDTALNEQVGSVGLSGIGYGLFGLLWVGRRWRPEFRDFCNDTLVAMFAIWLAICIFLTYVADANIANGVHAVGLAFGALYGMALYAPRHRIPWVVLSVVASAVVIGSMVALPGHPLYERHKRNEQIRGWRQLGVGDELPRPRLLPDDPQPHEFCSAFVPLAGSLQAGPTGIAGGEELGLARRQVARGGQPSDHFLIDSREAHRVDAIIDERFPDDREQRADDLPADRLGVLADLPLGRLVHPQVQEVQQVVQIDFPVGFRVGRQRQVLASLFPGNALFDTLLVDVAGMPL